MSLGGCRSQGGAGTGLGRGSFLGGDMSKMGTEAWDDALIELILYCNMTYHSR